MMTFKKFLEYGGAFAASYREPKRFSPPAYRVTDPAQHHHQRAEWLAGIYNILLHYIEAGEFIQENGHYYELQSTVLMKWHPDAIHEFTNSGTIVRLNNPIQAYIPTKQKDGSTVPILQYVYVYEINVQAARRNQAQDFLNLRRDTQITQFAGHVADKMGMSRFRPAPGTAMFH